MLVDIPPIDVARPTGISRSEAGVAVRSDTLIRIGSNRITTGVLLMKALNSAASAMVARKVSIGLRDQRRARKRPIGSSAPVRTSDWPAIISAHTATRAWWPKPRNRSLACTGPCGPR